MNAELTALLRCPRCQSTLADVGDDTSTTESPALGCAGCAARFPIVEGVPRLAADRYVASFGLQWNRFDVAREAEDAAVFQVKTGVDPRSLDGATVLDAGCGGGRYARLLGRHGARVVGLDLSDAVVKAAALTNDLPNVLIAQADLLDPPVAEAAFDLVVSIGVLHHSPDPKRAFEQIAKRVKPGGRLAVWLYRRNTPPQEWINAALRSLTTRLPPRTLERFSRGLGTLGGVPVLNRTLNKIINFSNHPDWELRVCDNFDWYAPRYQSHHTLEELNGWFREAGFTGIETLRPAKRGGLYDWAYDRNLIVGSGVNVAGTRVG